MSKVVIGIDPDSDKHGVAVYRDGVLHELKSLNNLDISMRLDEKCWGDDVTFSIEDVNGVSAAFGARDSGHNVHVKLKMAQSIGMCKQSQIELERMLKDSYVKVAKHKISKMWKKDKTQFERVTGWTGRSNEDTRSAAYFGWLETI